MSCEWRDKIFSVTKDNFEPLCLEIFRFQYRNNRLYRSFVNALQVNMHDVSTVEDIPFLPVHFFKTQEVKTGEFDPQRIFESSGTTGNTPARHFVKDIRLYTDSFVKTFELFYGHPQDWCVVALLPSYLERENSSLVLMTEKLISHSRHGQSGFYLRNHEKLFAVLTELEKEGQKTILLGVAFALLDFAEKYSLPLHHTVIMETGGMKGRREELTRNEVHEKLKQTFSSSVIHSEYGMTELLSQAYSAGNGLFQCPPWMRVMVRDEEDPLMISRSGSGAINIIDLANVYSCSFIAADDAGKVYPDSSFEVLGRLDGSDLRGCSLLVL